MKAEMILTKICKVIEKCIYGWSKEKKWWRTSKIRQRSFSSFVLWCNYTVVAFTFTRQILLWWRYRLSFFWLWFKSRFSQRKMSFFRIYATWKVNIPSTRKTGFLGEGGGEGEREKIKKLCFLCALGTKLSLKLKNLSFK
jgi:hypothetical protein